jgi:predicted CXXCH cytochrome family protein
MKTLWKLPPSSTISRWIRDKQSNLMWSAGAGASVALVLMSCATSRTMMAPPSIPGATFIGSKECAECHEKVSRDFRTADHAKLQAKGSNAIDMGCESCHGPGSKHKEAGGGAGTIVNPKKSPDTCFQCHLDKKAQFMLPYSHPVLAGKMTCSDCHDSHKGNAVKGRGTQLNGKNETCFECHKSQFGPFVFSHDAVREGCSTCHNPHGSVNQKMLTERNNTLCIKCHFDANTGPTGNMGRSGGHFDQGGDSARGSCWSAGCHFSVHGSNVNNSLRY